MYICLIHIYIENIPGVQRRPKDRSSGSHVSVCLSPLGNAAVSEVTWVPLRFRDERSHPQHVGPTACHTRETSPELMVELNPGEIQSDGESIVTAPSCVPIYRFTRGLAIHAASTLRVELDWKAKPCQSDIVEPMETTNATHTIPSSIDVFPSATVSMRKVTVRLRYVRRSSYSCRSVTGGTKSKRISIR
jgi:hypothetical protein